ncbi:hypothetical protein [Mycobacterium colombiense]|uniref:hypothetical protein n=1 Tax=Mycobacterium colombiense TaxID=339268 RepID=UPI0027E366E5|nr:hypothetical protein [Mycobacterium colombiense]
MPRGARQRQATALMMLPPMALRERRIEECPTMWFNRDFFQRPWPDWKVDVDVDRLTTLFSHTNPGETIVGHPAQITLVNPGVVWVTTDRFCRMGGPFAEVLIEARWPD